MSLARLGSIHNNRYAWLYDKHRSVVFRWVTHWLLKPFPPKWNAWLTDSVCHVTSWTCLCSFRHRPRMLRMPARAQRERVAKDSKPRLACCISPPAIQLDRPPRAGLQSPWREWSSDCQGWMKSERWTGYIAAFVTMSNYCIQMIKEEKCKEITFCTFFFPFCNRWNHTRVLTQYYRIKSVMAALCLYSSNGSCRQEREERRGNVSRLGDAGCTPSEATVRWQGGLSVNRR